MGSYADNFDPPSWWLRQLRAHMEPRGSQSALLRALKAAFKVDYDKGKLSRLVSDDPLKHEGAPVDMLVHISLVLGLPIPILIVMDEGNAKRLLAEAILSGEVDPKMAKIAAGVRHMLTPRHTERAESEDGPISGAGSGGRAKR